MHQSIRNGREDTKIQRYKDTKMKKETNLGRLSDRAELSDRETYKALQELENALWKKAGLIEKTGKTEYKKIAKK